MPANLPPPDAVWLTVPEAAAVMRLGKNRVYQLCQTGELPHRRVGVSIHIRRETAETWTPEDTARPAGRSGPMSLRA
jgi:excisionase family DNA binding protein